MIPLAAFLPGGQEWLLIFLAILVLFGGRKLPELARALGTSITQFKRGLKDEAEAGEKLSAPKDGETQDS